MLAHGARLAAFSSAGSARRSLPVAGGEPFVFDASDQNQWVVLDLGRLASVHYVSSDFAFEDGGPKPKAIGFDASLDGEEWVLNAFGTYRGAPLSSPVGFSVDQPVRLRFLRYRFGPRSVQGGAVIRSLHAKGSLLEPC